MTVLAAVPHHAAGLKLSEEGALFCYKTRDVGCQLAQKRKMLLMNHKEIPSGTLRIDASTPVQLHSDCTAGDTIP